MAITRHLARFFFFRKIRKPKGVVEALVLGAQQGLKLVANIFGVLVVFLALVDFADATVMWLGERVDIHGLTLTVRNQAMRL